MSFDVKIPESKLIVDQDNIYELPRRFRSITDYINDSNLDNVDITGLFELNISGSGVFSQKGLQKMKEEINHPSITIVDTRNESHGYVNGMAISWYGKNNYVNKSLTPEEVMAIERKNLDSLKGKETIEFEEWKGKSIPMQEPVKPQTVQTEEQMVKKEGLGYLRLFVTDHNKPSDEQIDRFVNFVRALPKGEWLHFHCRGGVGRTTTFMIFYDMLNNASKVSCEDIIKRQHLIGGRDMYNLSKGTYKHEAAVERLELIEKFYDYCLINHKSKYFTSWSDWTEQNK